MKRETKNNGWNEEGNKKPCPIPDALFGLFGP